MSDEIINGHKHILLNFKKSMTELSDSEKVYLEFNKRRSVRDFSKEWISEEVIQNIILAASTAPSGAHKQPWTFVAISNPEIKTEIRKAAEAEEIENYNGRMSDNWVSDLKPLNTDSNKPFLEDAPWLIVIFKKTYNLESGTKTQNYYVNESVGIASGMLIQAIHQSGLVCLTHTPSPMNFLNKILERPINEKPFLLIPVGYPAEKSTVPDLERKSLEEISVFLK